MISIYQLKPKFQQLLMPALRLFHKWGITANQLTFSGIVLSLIIGVLFWFADQNTLLFLALPIGLFIRMALNALDGLMARTYNQQSKNGEILNELGDIVSDFLVFFPLLKFEQAHLYLIVLFMVLAIINEFAGLLGKVVGKERRYDGPMGKSDRALVMGVYGILGALSISIAPYTRYIFLVLVLLLCISTAIRIKKSLDL